MALQRSRRALDTHPRIQLQVGTAGDGRSRRPKDDLHLDLWRRRVAWRFQRRQTPAGYCNTRDAARQLTLVVYAMTNGGSGPEKSDWTASANCIEYAASTSERVDALPSANR